MSIGRAQFLPVPALDEAQSTIFPSGFWTFGQLVTIFGQLVTIVGQLVTIFGKLVTTMLNKTISDLLKLNILELITECPFPTLIF